MSVQAKFIADFSSFTSAVEKAEVRLKTFESGIGRIDKDLSKFGNQFSGTSLIREATLMEKAIDSIGGTSKLTKAELERAGNTAAAAAEKMRLLGVDVPERLQNLAKHAKSSTGELTSMSGILSKLGPTLAATFSVGAIVGFAKEIGSFAGKMNDLSAETGIGTERLQALNYAASGAGLTIEDITGGINQLSKRLAGGDGSASAAVDKLNLSIYTLQQLSPDEAFIALSKAIAGVENPMERTRIAMELFGKSGARMLRLMTDDVEGLIGAAEKSGAVIEDELIKKADAFDDAWTQAILKVKGLLAGFVLGPSTEQIGKQIEQFRDFQRKGGKLTPQQEEQLGNLLDQFNATTAGNLAGGLRGGIAQPQALQQIMTRENLGNLLDADKKKAAADLKAADAAEKFADSLQQFQTDVFRQGAAANAKGGELGFLAGATAIDKSTSGFFPEPGRLDARFGDPTAFNLLPPTIGGKNNVRGAAGFNFSAFLGKNFAPTLLSAVTGGGSVTKSIGSLVGSGLTEKLFGGALGKTVTDGLSKVLGKSIGGALGSVLPGIGALAGPAIQGIGKLFGKLFGSENKKVNDLRDQFVSAAGGITKLDEAAHKAGTSVDQLLRAKTVKDYEKAVDDLKNKLGEFTNDQEADAARLEAAIQKYGFSFEQAGAAFQKQHLDDQAKELIEDWRVLVGSGIDLGLVNEKMAGAINEYLQTALKVGAEVPNAFRPILQKMLEQGTLTDEAGNAITDLEGAGIHFAETMTQGFDRVVQKLDELISKLQEAGTAIGSLPAFPTGPSNSGPAFETQDFPAFARGTGGGYPNFGSGTMAMLHGRERVMTAAEGQAEATSMAAVVSAIQVLGAQIGAMNASMSDQIRAAVVIGRARYA